MSKKKINPEDLQLRDEILNGNNYPNVETTRNTCWPKETEEWNLPYDCDTTLTDQSAHACTSVPEDKCNQSLLVCQTNKCATNLCNDTQSAGIICCDTIKNCKETNFCQVYPSIDVCIETAKYCNETDNNCLITPNCVDTDMCVYPPFSMEIDCQVPAD